MAGRRPQKPDAVAVLGIDGVQDEPTQRALDHVVFSVRQLQSRVGAVGAVADAAAVPVPLMWVNADDFGALGDGMTDNTAGIQAALDAAEGKEAVVYVGTGVHLISNTLFVPNKVVLTGIGRDGAGRIMASSTFPTDGRPMIRLGRAADALVFGCRVESIVLDGNSRAGTVIYSTAANEQSGARFVVAENFTQYGIHFNAASIITIENVEVYPPAAGATTGIYLQSCAGDNLVQRATIGVSGPLTNGMHIQSTQCIAQSIHVEDCTTGINLDDARTVLLGVSGPTGTANVTDLIVEQGNTRYNVGLNLVKNLSTRLLTASFGGYTNADPYMPLWVGGDAIIGGATQYPREIVPAQITSNQNDYSPPSLSSAQVVHLSSDAARDITGIVAGNPGRRIQWRNRGAFNITFKHLNGGSLSANQIKGRGNADVILLPGTTVETSYSGLVDFCWNVMNNP